MLDYIKGNIEELSPAHVVLENAGMGYYLNISLPTYSQLSGETATKLYVYEAIREDAFVLYGFLDKAERQLFLHLLSVSGVGAGSARMIMSSLSVAEIQEAIATENVLALKAVKGIGLKTAERIIVDLKSKINRVEGAVQAALSKTNPARAEAVSALVMLGFNTQASAKAVDKAMQSDSSAKVEQVIKAALKQL
ncbi:MAG: Holliday junction branch migration protein RuvA [Prevotellaceae bacterium]|jgi:Holliday junction DNA helicase RuvA|nr:Holliday junction branch migration protein RuvA [Prevotellaceae bacterium]